MEKNRLTSANWIYYEQIYRCEFIEQIHELYFMNKFIVIYYYKKKKKTKRKSQIQFRKIFVTSSLYSIFHFT